MKTTSVSVLQAREEVAARTGQNALQTTFRSLLLTRRRRRLHNVKWRWALWWAGRGGVFEHRGCVDGFLRDVVISRWRRKEHSGDKPLMVLVRLLMHLADLPQHGSPLCFLPPPTPTPIGNPSTWKLSAYIPHWRRDDRWQPVRIWRDQIEQRKLA